ncbi:winged helix DNA-binding protein [Mesorhizobium sp. M0199]|uniref:winged helix DNA-binding protein n=1 Tax=unclassified Mesorhizobium TaxID=325217 RepID=UPI00333BBE01
MGHVRHQQLVGGALEILIRIGNRLCEAGLVARDHDEEDHRRVLLRLTDRADDSLADLSAAHLDELGRIEPMLKRLLAGRGA